MKRRRLVIAAAIVVVVAGGAIGAAVALSGSGRPLVEASFPGYAGISFRYPESWRRVDWCWTSTEVSPMALLTSGRRSPPCVGTQLFGGGTPLPPPQRLAEDGVSVWWLYTDRSGLKPVRSNTRIGGRPADLAVSWQRPPKSLGAGPRCVDAQRQRRLVADIQAPRSSTARFEAGAVVCGPDYAGGEAAVRRMLDSVRFSGS